MNLTASGAVWRSNTADHLVEDVLPVMKSLGAKTTDIMVMNVGVWYNDEDMYALDMELFSAGWHKHKADLPIGIWRDTSPQHFDTPTGAAGTPFGSIVDGMCMQLANVILHTLFMRCVAAAQVQMHTESRLVALGPAKCVDTGVACR